MNVTNPFDHRGVRRGANRTLGYEGAPQTYIERLSAVVEDRPEHTAVVSADGSLLRYAELWERCSRFAGGMARSGVVPGDRIAIDLPNGTDWVIAFVSALLAGAVPVPLDQRATRDAVQAVVQDARPALVINTDTRLCAAEPLVVERGPDDLGLLLYTSGTTGRPKGVMIAQRNLAALPEITRRVLYQHDDSPSIRALVAIPLWHAAGCNAVLLPVLGLGGTCIIARSSGPTSIMDAIAEHRPDLVLAVPALFELLLRTESQRLEAASWLRHLIYGAAPVPEKLIRRLKELRPESALGNAFGMTEITNMATFLPEPFALTHPASIGFPVPGVEVEIRQPAGESYGEMYLRGPNMALGYWQQPEQTAQTFGSGWVRSGDIATVDTNGLVFIRGRAKDVINRGGEKIYATEVESALLDHPSVEEVAVIPVSDDVYGETVGAVVVSRQIGLEAAELLSHAAERLPRYALPERVVVRQSALPKTATGKVQKSTLRSELGW